MFWNFNIVNAELSIFRGGRWYSLKYNIKKLRISIRSYKNIVSKQKNKKLNLTSQCFHYVKIFTKKLFTCTTHLRINANRFAI